MGTPTQTDTEFNIISFERRLTSLKDSQESINACCQWCLENRNHHKKIVTAWLNVLKRVRVEQRLILFYLANDVIQYSKRRHYEYVESWGTTLQKATTMVRDERVKHKILRIFKIWEQRGVYNEEFISDLCGLISMSPTAPKTDEPHEFQSNHLIKKIKYCSALENDTDSKLKELKEHNPKMQLEAEMCTNLKDRAHVDDVEKELDTYVKHLEDYISALKLEIKNRINLISVLRQGETQLESDKKDVKVVANAYRTFAVRVKSFQRKLDEHKANLVSPLPSPDINAPSPSSDSDIDLPEEDLPVEESKDKSVVPDFSSLQYTNAGYYNPVPPPITTESNSSFVTNGFSSFIGSSIPFNLQDFNNSIFSNNSTLTSTNNLPPSISNSAPTATVQTSPINNVPANNTSISYQYGVDHMPLLPPPMPPFSSKNDSDYGKDNFNYNSAPTDNYNTSNLGYSENPSYQTTDNQGYNTPQVSSEFNVENYQQPYDPPPGANPYPPSEDYNPEQELDTWDPDPSWQPPIETTDTPESPPMFEKEGYCDPVEYHDVINEDPGADVDHRVIPIIPIESEDSLGRGQDVDHRNLISLTGSPATDSNSNIPLSDTWNNSADKDYRIADSIDQDYRLPPFNIEQLKLPPPPPPPQSVKNNLNQGKLIGAKLSTPQDNVESIDMDLSDEDIAILESNNLKMVMDSALEDPLTQLLEQSSNSHEHPKMLEPPPPFFDLPDDEDANHFLDDLDNELNSTDFTSNLNQAQEYTNDSYGSEPSNWGNVDIPPPQFPNIPDMSSAPPIRNLPFNFPGMPPPNLPPNILQQNINIPPSEPQNMDNSIPVLEQLDQQDLDCGFQDNWMQNNPPPQGFPFRGRGRGSNNRGGNFNNNWRGNFNTNNRGRGRGRGEFFRGNNNFRPNRGNRPNRGGRGRSNFRGNFRGNF